MLNRAARTMFDRSESEIVGHNVSILMPEPYRSEHDSYIADYLRTGESKVIGVGREVQGQRRDGSTFPINLAVTEFQLHNRRYFVAIVRDISEQKTLEAQLHQSQKMEAFGQLAGGVAHDFNNLLTVISGYSELLLAMLPADDEKRGMVTDIRDAGNRAASLTRQLLAFSRRQIIQPRVLDLNAVVADVERMLRRVIGEDVQLVTVLQPAISAVRADPVQVEQVILNLAVNSRDAMPDGGMLTIETSEVELGESYTNAYADVRPGRFVMLAIRDTGSGITPEVKARLFEPFFTTKGVGRGTGLGLAVVQGIVSQSDGIIDVETGAGAGTTFRIYLPAVEEQPATLPDAGLEPSPSGSEAVLLVEDDDSVRGVTAVALRGFGYTVVAARSGRAALELMTSRPERIDLLVSDVVMPDMNGRELSELLLARYPEMRVLFLSGYTDDAVVRHGVLRAEVAFLQKPFTPIVLATKVRSLLDGD
jgi:hypothetical protein